MILLIHISVALASMALASLALIVPSQRKLRLSQALVAATLASGTYLVISTKVNVLRVCLMGLVYLAVVGFMLVVASRKLEAVKSLSRN